jgi:tRNA-dihydrouridine synthase 2
MNNFQGKVAGTFETDYSSLWGLSEYCSKKQLEFKENGLQDRYAVVPILLEPQLKKRKMGAEAASDDIIEMQCSFNRSLYTSDVDLPKTQLLTWARTRGLKHPIYTTQQEDKLFKSVVTLDGKKYSSSYWYVEVVDIFIHV